MGYLFLLIILGLIGFIIYNKFQKSKVESSQKQYEKEAAVLDFKRKDLIVETNKLKEELKTPTKELTPSEVESFWDDKK